jgi:hypothetical protein
VCKEVAKDDFLFRIHAHLSGFNADVLDISSVFRMKNLLDVSIDNDCFWINPVEKCTRSFPRRYVNRGKMTS